MKLCCLNPWLFLEELSGRQHWAPSFRLWSPALLGFEPAWQLPSNIKPRHRPFCQQRRVIPEENNLTQEITGSRFQVPFTYVPNYSPQCNVLSFVFLCSQSSKALAVINIQWEVVWYWIISSAALFLTEFRLIAIHFTFDKYLLWKNAPACFLLLFFFIDFSFKRLLFLLYVRWQ